MKYLLLSLSFSVVLFFTAGCKPAPSGIGGKVVTVEEGPIVTLTSDEGKVQVLAGAAELSLPEAYPDDVPLYGEHRIHLTSWSPRGVAVEFRSSHPAVQIADFYQSELAKQGWNVAETISSGETYLVKATRGDRQVVMLAGPQDSSAEPAGISVMLTVTGG